jgi:hypothetical protein
MANREWYCEHGMYIGHQWGPDYLCGYCEDGVTVAMLDAWDAEEAARVAALPKCEVVGCQKPLDNDVQRIFGGLDDAYRWAFSPDGTRVRYCVECFGNIHARRAARAAARSTVPAT